MWITKLVIAITATYVIGEAKKTLHLQGFLPMTGTGWISGGACIPAVLMALRDVNNHPGLLTGYNLSYSLADTQVRHTNHSPMIVVSPSSYKWMGTCYKVVLVKCLMRLSGP